MTRRTRRDPAPTASSVVMIGTATAFVFSTAVVGLVVDQDGVKPPVLGTSWTLRGEVEDSSLLLLPTSHRT